MAKKKLLGALPVGFKGKFAGVPFSISVQYDIYGNVSAIVLGDKNNTIVAIDGDKKKEKAFVDTFNGYIYKGSGYSDIETYNKNYFTKVKNFVKNINQEVNDYNKKQMPIKKAVKKVAKKVATKKAIVKKAVKKSAPKKAVIKRVVKKTAPKKAIKKTIIKPAIKKQTGTSNIAFDKRHQALPAGKRTSASGNVYYESRANRSDAGKLLGIPKGKKLTKVGSLPTYKDPIAVREISIYADSDAGLYQSSRQKIEKNLSKKYIKGTFDLGRSEKLWKIYIENALKKYTKEFGSRSDKWTNLLSVADRKLLAQQYAIEYLGELQVGNYTL
jgi:hypothetical protein